MIILTDEQKEFIKKNIPAAWDAFVNDDYRELQIEIGIYQATTGFDKYDEITDYGRKVERMLDSIQSQN